MRKWHLVIDVALCENCNNCYLACKDEHVDNDWPGYAAPQPGQGQGWIRIQATERGQYPLIDVAYRPILCMQCDDAPCVKAGNGAVYKRPDGIVIIDPVKAKGMKNLVNACPYGAIQWNEGLELPQKCTLCAHLLDDGWGKTRCVQSCPTGAQSLLYIEDDEMRQVAEKEHLEVYQPERRTSPLLYYKNLHRVTRCFVGGSVAVRVDGKEECAEGAQVTLLNASKTKVGERTTDPYGDFKFDDLVENGGAYSLQLTYPGHDVKTIELDLKASLNVGTIVL
ncbi:MAG: (4Fe-4S)-binding protein [Chloroflexi bacterium]|nr:(4Fe-4S)-binding protein [Chloroflexota bacterium]